jgi:hypothetical protein
MDIVNWSSTALITNEKMEEKYIDDKACEGLVTFAYIAQQ